MQPLTFRESSYSWAVGEVGVARLMFGVTLYILRTQTSYIVACIGLIEIAKHDRCLILFNIQHGEGFTRLGGGNRECGALEYTRYMYKKFMQEWGGPKAGVLWNSISGAKRSMRFHLKTDIMAS